MVVTADLHDGIPALRDAVYLNTGTFGPSPAVVMDSIRQGLDLVERHGGYAPLVRQRVEREGYEQARTEAAQMLGATADEIFLTRSASDGINTLAHGLDWRPGDEVLISAEEHASGILPWLMLARRSGLVVRVFPVSADPAAVLVAAAARITDRTRLVFVSHVSGISGMVLPVAGLCQLARAAGALAVVDGSHAVGQWAVDVRALGADAYIACGHKWLLGPQGTSFAYLAREHLETIQPSWIGWGAHDEFSLDLAAGTFDLPPSARRFEFGTKPWPLYLGLARAIRFIRDEVTLEAIQAHVRPQAAWLKRALAAWPGVRLLTPSDPALSAGIVSVELPASTPPNLKDLLWARHRVIAAYHAPPRRLRLSVAFFTRRAELETALAALEDCLGR
jgi:selenocysteine lyase/cysteine desulfurase